MRSQEHEKIREKCHQVPANRGATLLRKGYDKGLTEDIAVLPESTQQRQSETSIIRSVK
jgi:hypothetical protein